MARCARPAVMLCLAAGWLIPAAHAGVADDLAAGVRLLQAGRVGAGRDRIERALGQDNGVATAHSGLGAALLLQGDAAGAADEFRLAAALDGGAASARIGLVACHLAGDDAGAALAETKHGLALDSPHKTRLRSSYAYLCCLTGLYDAAIAEGSRVLAVRPDDALARQAVAAAQYARGEYEAAAQTLGRSSETAAVSGLAVNGLPRARSPLFSAGSAYRLAHRDHEREGLAFLPLLAAGAEPAVGGAERPSETTESSAWPDSGVVAPVRVAGGVTPGAPGPVTITAPHNGSELRGPTDVSVEVAERGEVAYVVLLTDGTFHALSNTYPHRLRLDTRKLAGGPHRLRVDAYTQQGHLVGSTSIGVRVAGAHRGGVEDARGRTTLPQESALLAEVERELQELLALRADPLAESQLRGRLHEARGREAEALATYEAVFAARPTWPGAKTDMLWAYRRAGILELGTRPREIHELGVSRAVALTFDDGPHPEITPYILDLLDRYHARATFMLVGKQVELYPRLAAEIVRRGHEVGSHSYSHRDLRPLSLEEIEWELVKARAVIRRATGRTVRLFRPPGGHYNRTIREATIETGLQTVFWDSNIGSFEHTRARQAAEKMTRELSPSGIALLHNGEDATVRILPELLPRLTEEGFRLETISALVGGEGG